MVGERNGFFYLRASQFSRDLLERTGIPDRDKNARLNTVKLIKYSRFRAFLAPFKRRELRCPTFISAWRVYGAG